MANLSKERLVGLQKLCPG